TLGQGIKLHGQLRLEPYPNQVMNRWRRVLEGASNMSFLTLDLWPSVSAYYWPWAITILESIADANLPRLTQLSIDCSKFRTVSGPKVVFPLPKFCQTLIDTDKTSRLTVLSLVDIAQVHNDPMSSQTASPFTLPGAHLETVLTACPLLQVLQAGLVATDAYTLLPMLARSLGKTI